MLTTTTSMLIAEASSACLTIGRWLGIAPTLAQRGEASALQEPGGADTGGAAASTQDPGLASPGDGAASDTTTYVDETFRLPRGAGP